jgi:DNA polymerase III alpha subunit (gram-positive type)
MLVLSLDFETTGLDAGTDQVIEIGAVLYSSVQKKCLNSQGLLVKSDIPINPKITKLTGITQEAVNRFGYDSKDSLRVILDMAEEADALIGYNIRSFDKLFLENWAGRFADELGRELPDKTYIDLYHDLPWQVPMGKLSHVAADHGILNLFPHSALADAQTVLTIAEKYDFDFLLTRAQSSVIVLRSHQSRNENDVVKQAPWKFRWNPKMQWWWKAVKVQDVDEIITSAPFHISIEKEISPEELA